MPSVLTWLLIAMMVAALGAVARNALIGALALLPWALGNSAMSGTRSAASWSLDASAFSWQQGLGVLTTCYTVGLVVAIVSVWFVARTNHRQRALDKTPSGAMAAVDMLTTILIRSTADKLGASTSSQQ